MRESLTRDAEATGDAAPQWPAVVSRNAGGGS